MDQLPLVSICCLAYNHQSYISKCLEGFLFQKTSFVFEVLIHDDASTDDTAKIIKDYELKYSEIIKPIYQFENQKSKGVGVTRVYNFPRAKGKYIAMCEGDDYWIDPYKLQKQVDLLEANNDYGLIHGDCEFLYSNGRIEKDVNKHTTKNRQYKTKDEIFNGLITAEYKIRTATVMFRKSLYDSICDQIGAIRGNFLMGDTPMWLLMILKSDFYYIDEVLAVYRLSPQSASRPRSVEKKLRFILSSAEVRIYFLKWLNKEIPNTIKYQYNEALVNYKLYNADYREMYPLLNPSSMHLFINKYSKVNWIRNILRLRLKPNYIKIIYKKIIK